MSLEPVVGSVVRYIKTHEGHTCRVTGTVHNDKNKLMKVAVRCECGSQLFLNPRDMELMRL